jgi:hypothetical protein
MKNLCLVLLTSIFFLSLISTAVAATLLVPATVNVGSQVQVQGCGYENGDVNIKVRTNGLKQSFSVMTINGCLAPAYFLAKRKGIYTITATQNTLKITTTMLAI